MPSARNRKPCRKGSTTPTTPRPSSPQPAALRFIEGLNSIMAAEMVPRPGRCNLPVHPRGGRTALNRDVMGGACFRH